MFKTYLLLLLLCFPCTNSASGQANFLLFTPEQINSVREAINSDRPDVRSSQRDLRKIADKLLELGPWSITNVPGKAISGDPHDYYSESPYWWPDPESPDGPYIRKDGLRNPNRFEGHKSLLHQMTQSVFALSMAGYFFNEPRYIDHAALLLRVWFIDPETRMNPHLDYGQAIPNKSDGRGVGIIDTHRLAKMVIGLGFLSASGRWDPAEKEQLRAWFRNYINWMMTSRNGREEQRQGNNHSTWWAVQMAGFAGFTGQSAIQDSIWRYSISYLLENQIAVDGSFPLEEARTRSYDYSLFNMTAFTMLFRMASLSGTDLWQQVNSNGAGLQKSLRYMLPYVKDPDTWSKEQITSHSQEPPVAYLLAGLDLRNMEYIKLYKDKTGERNSEAEHDYDPFILLMNLIASQI